MMKYTIRYVSLLAGMLTVFSSCEHKDLCFDHDAHAPKSDASSPVLKYSAFT